MRGWCVAVKSLLVFSINDMKRSRILLPISTSTCVCARFPVRHQLKCLGVDYTVDNSLIFWAMAVRVNASSELTLRKYASHRYLNKLAELGIVSQQMNNQPRGKEKLSLGTRNE